MVAEHISDVVGRDHQRVPSLVDVLCTLAAHWVLCECGMEIGKAGLDGWVKKGLRLGEEIDLLNVQIPIIESPTKKLAFQANLEQLEAQSKALNDEWGQAYAEADAYSEMFWDAREFCTKACGIGDNELFNAALVGFDPERLQPGQGPSKHRMTELAMLLSNLNRDKWESQPWANPTKPTMRTAKRVAPDRLNSFIVHHLKHVETTSIDEPPYLGLMFHDDSTVSRLGDAYKDKRTSVISLSPQQFKILKFIHGAGIIGRTKSEMDAEGFTSLKQEKTKINEKLIPLDLRFAIGEHKLIHTGKEQVTKLVTS